MTEQVNHIYYARRFAIEVHRHMKRLSDENLRMIQRIRFPDDSQRMLQFWIKDHRPDLSDASITLDSEMIASQTPFESSEALDSYIESGIGELLGK